MANYGGNVKGSSPAEGGETQKELSGNKAKGVTYSSKGEVTMTFPWEEKVMAGGEAAENEGR